MQSSAESTLNPYAAPQAELHLPASPLFVFANGAMRSWLIVFLVNLPYPILLGWQICANEGRLGMTSMLVLMLAVSSWLVCAKPWYGRRLIIGGVCIAISQCFPILQFMAGMLGMTLIDLLRLMPRRKPAVGGVEINHRFELNLPSAMFLTLFGGSVLMLVALGIGSLFLKNERRELIEEVNENNENAGEALRQMMTR